jgi:hypothetical protein
MTIGEQMQRPDTSGLNHKWDWILWWRIDPVQLEEQVRLYDTIGFRSSMRGISVACLVFSMLVTVLMTYFGGMGLNASAYVDAGLFGMLAGFIWFGHRWAMVGAMLLWTLEKVAIIVGHPVMVVAQLVWWCLYMHAFYFAFRIERRRRQIPAVEVF